MANHPLLSALWALLIHGLIGVAVIWPILRRSERRRLYTALVFAGASLIDLDHIVVAGSLSPHSLETLSGRPETHSLIVAVLVGVMAFALSRRPLLGWCAVALVTSHLLFDAAGGGTPLLAPLAQTRGIPWLLCPLGIALLWLASAILAGAPWSSSSVWPARSIRSERSKSVIADASTRPQEPGWRRRAY
ncbi:MAG TPA: metal-dependent hydrolase [Solirubrobacteraceae bacterium]|nr:metal-dependent hydrolase [Solirubrobacteraceae bacterium]